MSNPKRIRVLLIAEACNPSWTSVPLVGFNLARALSRQADLEVTLVTHVRNQIALSQSDVCSTAKVHFIDNEFIAAPAYRLARLLRGGDQLSWTIDTAMAWPSYVVFEKMVASKFGRSLARGDFDLIHRITPLSPTAVSPLAGMTKVPMIAGPLNGGLPWPRDFPELVRREREWLVPLRNAYKLLPYHRATYRHLAGIIAASQSTANEIPKWFRGSVFRLPENAVDPERFPLADHWPEPQGKFHLITAGRLVPYKGLALTLEAIRRSDILRQCGLSIIGDGPERANLESFVKLHQLQESIAFLGQKPQVELAKEFQRSQLFVFPSLREFGGGVVLEAMASALPSVVVDYGGPAELVTTASAIKLPMQPREPLFDSLQRSLEYLVTHPEVCRRMGNAAVKEVRLSHTWQAKAEAIVQIYREILAKTD